MKLDVEIKRNIDAKNICGVNNSNIKVIEELYNTLIELNGPYIIVKEDNIDILNELNSLFTILIYESEHDINITPKDIVYAKEIVSNGNKDLYLKFLSNRKPICYTRYNKPIYAKTLKQDEYIKSIYNHDLVFSIGAAGTGKTYLAVCYGVSLLKSGKFEKIILTRPAVEAGESLGFLPGDLKEKVDPYLRPLYDALYDMLGVESVNQLIEKQVIEIAPLAYMRGRTLENAFIILDEAQNATIDQLKMFLTRLGFNSKMVVTGDISQIDLPNNKKSGLKISSSLLKDLNEVDVINFEKCDVVRHPLVAKIIERFENLQE
jgi:phosphate starvation-inducible PhoH-like protein